MTAAVSHPPVWEPVVSPCLLRSVEVQLPVASSALLADVTMILPPVADAVAGVGMADSYQVFV
jgi:hypothetical protein